VNRKVFWGLMLLFTVWHAVSVSIEWSRAQGRSDGLDFASYYYAVGVAKDGRDPYRKRQLKLAAVADINPRTGKSFRKAVHPFFYPPPFVLVTAWVDGLDMITAYRLWFWLDELFTILCGLVLWRWWRPMGPALPVVIAASIAVLTAIPNNHFMGQANIPVLFLVLFGLWQEEEGRPTLGGASVGLACMLKMSPALFVAWWLLRWRWRAVVAAVITALFLTLMSLLIVQPEYQIRFYLRVLPMFANGNYNGLSVPIDMFGNHSLPNLLHQFLPGGTAHRLGRLTGEVSRVLSLCMVAGVGTAWWWDTEDRFREWAQLASVGVLLLMIPVYTYEHHVVWALPAVVLCVMAAIERTRLSDWASALMVAAVFVWAFELAMLKPVWQWLLDQGGLLSPLAFVVQELKMLALITFGVLTAVMGTTWGLSRQQLQGLAPGMPPANQGKDS